MRQKDLYFIVVGIAAFICLAMILPRLWHKTLLKNRRGDMVRRTASIARINASMAPSIESINSRLHEKVKPSKKELTSLTQVYSQYPAEDTGNNMAALWTKVDSKEKTKVIERLDQQITESKKAIDANPADKKAKHMLFISETLKKACKSNFDFNLLETIPQNQGGLKSRYKK